jgi:hypothetical protein
MDKKNKIQEFKVKDDPGNWRVIPCLYNNDFPVLFNAFHKTSQELLEKIKRLSETASEGST